ncbi:helix-turn-helix domain-containing protein [Pinirhizobacter soli]|uniref:helix-turn-helix domain-containing protein n=1 Tax=Pinirhizobacter soli TaxID=2786953 RepID=UPI00202A9541|nr:AraC family transcriptional regulator [Pinirhizobacter soli]
MSIMQTVLHSAHFKVVSHVCRHPRVDCGYVQGDDPARVLFTRRGSFAMHVGAKTYFARPGQAVLIRRNIEYRVTHPDREGCDCCTDVLLDEAALDMFGLAQASTSSACVFGHDMALQMTHVELLLGLRRDDASTIDGEDLLFELFDRLIQENRKPSRLSRPVAARQVAKVEEAIIGHAGENLSVQVLAGMAGCSPFHLSRIFRQHTGQSLRQFRVRQRLGNAIDRLAEGEDDLAALACDVGFNSHSHMTDAFHQTLGRSPRQLREQLRQVTLKQLRRKLGCRRMHP